MAVQPIPPARFYRSVYKPTFCTRFLTVSVKKQDRRRLFRRRLARRNPYYRVGYRHDSRTDKVVKIPEKDKLPWDRKPRRPKRLGHKQKATRRFEFGRRAHLQDTIACAVQYYYRFHFFASDVYKCASGIPTTLFTKFLPNKREVWEILGAWYVSKRMLPVSELTATPRMPDTLLRGFPCKLCPFLAKNLKALGDHLHQKHQLNATYRCEICNAPCNSDASARTHKSRCLRKIKAEEKNKAVTPVPAVDVKRTKLHEDISVSFEAPPSTPTSALTPSNFLTPPDSTGHPTPTSSVLPLMPCFRTPLQSRSHSPKRLCNTPPLIQTAALEQSPASSSIQTAASSIQTADSEPSSASYQPQKLAEMAHASCLLVEDMIIDWLVDSQNTDISILENYRAPIDAYVNKQDNENYKSLHNKDGSNQETLEFLEITTENTRFHPVMLPELLQSREILGLASLGYVLYTEKSNRLIHIRASAERCRSIFIRKNSTIMVEHLSKLLDMPAITVSGTTPFRSIDHEVSKIFVSESTAEAKLLNSTKTKEMLLFVPDYTGAVEEALKQLIPSQHTVIVIAISQDVGLPKSWIYEAEIPILSIEQAAAQSEISEQTAECIYVEALREEAVEDVFVNLLCQLKQFQLVNPYTQISIEKILRSFRPHKENIKVELTNSETLVVRALQRKGRCLLNEILPQRHPLEVFTVVEALRRRKILEIKGGRYHLNVEIERK